jgi:hypothetical protein
MIEAVTDDFRSTETAAMVSLDPQMSSLVADS